MDASTPEIGTTVCPSCGQSFGRESRYCPTCGRPSAISDWDGPTMEDTPAVAAAGAAEATVGSTVHWQVFPEAPTQPSGMPTLGAGPAIAAAPPVKSHRLRNVLTVVSAICLVALLAGTSFWLYSAFAARSETAAARFLPANSVAFVSVDLTALANNSHNFSIQNLSAATGSNALQDTGLDLQKDILPWIGQYTSFAVFPQSSSVAGMPAVGEVAMLQSHDDNATAAALTKAVAYQRSHGKTVSQSQFGGFTLYTTGASASQGAVLTSGKGWAIFASNQQAAQAVINRINGQGDTLDSADAFKDATGSLPSGRFGTLYLNLRQLVSAVLPSGAPSGAASISIPFLDTYPTGAGSLEWTDAGLRGQMTFSAAHGTTIAHVSGNTTNLASLVPSTALGYQGFANVGGLASTFDTQFLPAAVSAQDPLKNALGVPSTDPALQQPAAVALLKSGSTVHPLFLLSAPDATAAQSLLQSVAQQAKWTLQPTTVAGQDATAIYGSTETATPTATATTTTAATKQLIGVAAISHGALIFAQSTADLSAALTVAAGNQASLATNANFAALQQQAGSSAVAASFIDVQGLAATMPGDKSATTNSTTTLPAKYIYTTLQWTNSQLQSTSNITLAK